MDPSICKCYWQGEWAGSNQKNTFVVPSPHSLFQRPALPLASALISILFSHCSFFFVSESQEYQTKFLNVWRFYTCRFLCQECHSPSCFPSLTPPSPFIPPRLGGDTPWCAYRPYGHKPSSFLSYSTYYVPMCQYTCLRTWLGASWGQEPLCFPYPKTLWHTWHLLGSQQKLVKESVN